MNEQLLTPSEEALLRAAAAEVQESEHKPIFCLVGSLSAIPPPEFSTLTVQRTDAYEASGSDPAQLQALAAWIEAYPSLTEAAKVEVPKT